MTANRNCIRFAHSLLGFRIPTLNGHYRICDFFLIPGIRKIYRLFIKYLKYGHFEPWIHGVPRAISLNTYKACYLQIHVSYIIYTNKVSNPTPKENLMIFLLYFLGYREFLGLHKSQLLFSSFIQIILK